MFDVVIDTKNLSRKYRTDVNRLISAWKRGLSDRELARRTGISAATLASIRGDLEITHRRARLVKKAELSPESSPEKRHIFLRPRV